MIRSLLDSTAKSQVAQASLNIIIKLRVVLSSDSSASTFQVLGFQMCISMSGLLFLRASVCDICMCARACMWVQCPAHGRVEVRGQYQYLLLSLSTFCFRDRNSVNLELSDSASHCPSSLVVLQNAGLAWMSPGPIPSDT